MTIRLPRHELRDGSVGTREGNTLGQKLGSRKERSTQDMGIVPEGKERKRGQGSFEEQVKDGSRDPRRPLEPVQQERWISPVQTG